jgi:hypothetical protein
LSPLRPQSGLDILKGIIFDPQFLEDWESDFPRRKLDALVELLQEEGKGAGKRKRIAEEESGTDDAAVAAKEAKKTESC